MDFDLNEEQRELRDTARRFLEREVGLGYARAMMDDARGFRDETWKQMAELGWMALAIPEKYEGLGLGPIALSILLIEMGRVVLPGPYLSTMLGAAAIELAGSDEQRARLLPRVASGDLILSLATDDRFVRDGHIAELIFLATDDRLTSVEPIERTPVDVMDQTRKVARIRYEAGEELGHGDAVFDRAALLVSAEMLGLAERVLEMSVDYAKERQQFGRPIGSFQAVKHRLADMHVDVESVRNVVYYASWAVEREHPDASLAVSMAKAAASDLVVRVAKSGIQVHGGIGFTWEHDMHLFFKRALADAASFGDATYHRERMATLLRARS